MSIGGQGSHLVRPNSYILTNKLNMIYLGSDHRGFELKRLIRLWLGEWQYEFLDVGSNDLGDEEDDYSDFALVVAKRLTDERGVENDMGILICGSGVGMSIAANRVAGVRCGLCTSVEQTIVARKEDDINCLALGADYLSENEAKEIVEAFLKTEFGEEERYIRRINKLT